MYAMVRSRTTKLAAVCTVFLLCLPAMEMERSRRTAVYHDAFAASYGYVLELNERAGKPRGKFKTLLDKTFLSRFIFMPGANHNAPFGKVQHPSNQVKLVCGRWNRPAFQGGTYHVCSQLALFHESHSRILPTPRKMGIGTSNSVDKLKLLRSSVGQSAKPVLVRTVQSTWSLGWLIMCQQFLDRFSVVLVAAGMINVALYLLDPSAWRHLHLGVVLITIAFDTRMTTWRLRYPRAIRK